MKRQKAVALGLLAVLILLVLLVIALQEGWVCGSVKVFLLTEDKGKTSLVPVARRQKPFRSLEEKLAFAMDELMKGPLDAEKEQGLETSVGSDARVLGARIESGIAYVDFTREIEKGGGIRTMQERLAQIVYTATQFPGVEKVRLLIEGREIAYFSQEGITDVEKPMGRAEVAEFLQGGSQ